MLRYLLLVLFVVAPACDAFSYPLPATRISHRRAIAASSIIMQDAEVDKETTDVSFAAAEVKELLEQPSSSSSSSSALTTKEDYSLAKSEVIKVAGSLANLGLEVTKVVGHTAIVLSADVVQAAGTAAGKAALNTPRYLWELKVAADAKAKAEAEAEAAAIAAAEAAAAPGLLDHIQAFAVNKLVEVDGEVKAAAMRRVQEAKQEVRAVPGKLLKKAERKALAQAERLKMQLRQKAVDQIDNLLQVDKDKK